MCALSTSTYANNSEGKLFGVTNPAYWYFIDGSSDRSPTGVIDVDGFIISGSESGSGNREDAGYLYPLSAPASGATASFLELQGNWSTTDTVDFESAYVSFRDDARNVISTFEIAGGPGSAPTEVIDVRILVPTNSRYVEIGVSSVDSIGDPGVLEITNLILGSTEPIFPDMPTNAFDFFDINNWLTVSTDPSLGFITYFGGSQNLVEFIGPNGSMANAFNAIQLTFPNVPIGAKAIGTDYTWSSADSDNSDDVFAMRFDRGIDSLSVNAPGSLQPNAFESIELPILPGADITLGVNSLTSRDGAGTALLSDSYMDFAYWNDLSPEWSGTGSNPAGNGRIEGGTQFTRIVGSDDQSNTPADVTFLVQTRPGVKTIQFDYMWSTSDLPGLDSPTYRVTGQDFTLLQDPFATFEQGSYSVQTQQLAGDPASISFTVNTTDNLGGRGMLDVSNIGLIGTFVRQFSEYAWTRTPNSQGSTTNVGTASRRIIGTDNPGDTFPAETASRVTIPEGVYNIALQYRWFTSPQDAFKDFAFYRLNNSDRIQIGDTWTVNELIGTFTLDVRPGDVLELGIFNADNTGFPSFIEFFDLDVRDQPDCPHDLNSDSSVDISDLLILLSNYDTTGNLPYVNGDINGDGTTDITDLLALLSSFDTDCP